MNRGNTTNAILVIMLVILVGFGVWYMMKNREANNDPSLIQVNIPEGNSENN